MADEFNPMDIAGRSEGHAARKARASTKAERGPNVAAAELRAFIERIERLNEEKDTVNDDIKAVYGEAKAHGFDTKALRRLVAIRKKDEAQWREEESVLDTYLAALGMLPDA